MIPLKIQLKNFLSYGPTLQTIDFGPYPLICLSGKNGHGKSALLDAITWAVWGQARKISGVAKADNHLLRLGQTQMMVIFDFLFNDNQYRIRREYAKTYGKPYATLDFGIIQKETQLYLPLTSKTIRDTQAIIETTLGLDFDSFINSAFLRQGQSNEFSKKSPKDRKEILSSILGLKHYDIMKKLALNKARDATTQLQQLHNFNEKIERELEKTSEIAIKIIEIQQQIVLSQAQDKKIIQKKIELETVKQNYTQAKNAEQVLHFQIQQKNKEQETLQIKLIALYKDWKKIHAQQKNMYDLTSLETKKQEILDKISLFQKQLQKSLELKTSILQYQQEEQILSKKFQDSFQQQIQEHQIQLLSLQTAVITKQAEEKELCNKQNAHVQLLQEITNKVTTLDENIKKITNSDNEKTLEEKRFEKRKAFYHQWIAQGNMVAQELSNIQQKQLLQCNDQNTSCPVCEQNLSASRKKFLKAKYTQDEQLLKHRFTRLSVITKKLKIVLVKQHAQLETLNNQLALRAQLNNNLQEFTKNKLALENERIIITKHLAQLQQEIVQFTTELTDKNKDIQLLQSTQSEQIINDPSYKNLKNSLEQTQEALDNTLYDAQEHQKTTQELQLLEQQRVQAHVYFQDVDKQKNRKEEIQNLCRILKSIKKEIREYTQKIKEYAHLEAILHTIQTEENIINGEIQTLQEQKEILLLEKGRLENERTNLLILEKEHARQKEEINSLKQTVDDYQILATTFGKDGIQALLIEEALPEIEQEANALLNQLTNNQSHIFIESLRDLQKGGTKETLDIKISDAQGIRPYELFSGGEAFRIDFALRIAISKLLARRAGTSLQTLIIDEGFGSQDEEGLAYIMDALHKIQDNFSKIIIVSHLTSMKDQFPVHFYIEKGAQGSTVNVVEQG